MLSTVLNKLLQSRRLYMLARAQSETDNSLQLSIACNLLQDSVETYLLGLSEHLNAGVGQRTDFDKYFELVNEKIAPKELPFRQRLISLNRLRINSKHYGLAPAKAELQPLVQTTYEFLVETTRAVLNRDFATLNLSDLLTDDEQKALLRAAESAFGSNDFETCLIECRKTLFVTFEWQFDATNFLKKPESMNGIAAAASRVPQHARGKDYLEKRVTCPTDFIIYDHAEHDVQLMKEGINPVGYWNVWRLTPAVYRESRESPWIVKRDFQKLDVDGIRDRAEYVLETVTELLLTHQEHSRRARSPDYRRFYVMLRSDATPVYQRASTSSPVVLTTPAGLRKVFCDYSTPGIDSESVFWHLSHWADGATIYGYVRGEDIDA